MNKLFSPFIALLAALLIFVLPVRGATIVVKISQFPNTTAPAGSDLFLLASGSTNKNITWNQLKDAIGTNPATVTILNNLYVSNVFATNINVTNLTVLNEFHGKTTITTNLYVDYITNNIAYITNLFLTEQVTNYFLFSTNIYQSYPTYVNNSYVSNYFQTNAFLDTYVSNYFNTNIYNYATNLYYFSTNLSVTNFYLTDNYISNFFNTNIFVVDNTVSNFFATNIYNTINISSNYTYQYDLNPTNLVMYGNTWMFGYADNPNPTLQIQGPLYSIFLDGGTGDIGLSGTVFASAFSLYEDSWPGPTNSVDMLTSDQYYVTYTPVSITGFTSFPTDPGQGWSGLITITNAASTNVLLTLPSGLRIPERTNQVTLSNASQSMLSIKWSHKSGTNGVPRQW